MTSDRPAMTHAELDAKVLSLFSVGGVYEGVAQCVEHDNRPHCTGEPTGVVMPWLHKPNPDTTLRAAAGWRTPSDLAYPFIENVEAPIPEIKVSRGGPRWGDPAIAARPKIERPPFDPRGHWEFAVDIAEEGEEPDIMSSGSAWHWEPYLTEEEARSEWPEGKLLRRWVPARGEWTDAGTCVCAEPLREGDILAPCPVHGWVGDA